ncbi:hypothetical protein So717_05880 [Roseobacter cerasinus]|uniref:DUF805 domain-containing protein n=1 Tax=Roseobacter cerasinus TaxID=2602289 RepID=A0A640VPN0_9RHOB|nr:DUF805 domain-containing protein [Roseobacter cerasinus]GFE48835.1 hypothetical protein So717_05880 [Roseobacter cerasinus]
MSLTESVKTCFRKYFTFSGRASRSEYWWFTLFAIALGLVASGLETFINAATDTPEGPLILSGAASLATLFPSLAVTWRRLHDIDRSGLWYPGLMLGIPLGSGLLLAGIGMLLSQVQGLYVGATLQLITLALLGICLIILIVWLCKKSQPGPNKYGPNPHEVTP